MLSILGVDKHFLLLNLNFNFLFHLHFKLDLVYLNCIIFIQCCLLFIVARINTFDKLHFFFAGLTVLIFLKFLLLFALSKHKLCQAALGGRRFFPGSFMRNFVFRSYSC